MALKYTSMSPCPSQFKTLSSPFFVPPMKAFGFSWPFFFFFFFFLVFCVFFILFYFIFKLYNIVLVLSNIKMNPPQVLIFARSALTSKKPRGSICFQNKSQILTRSYRFFMSQASPAFLGWSPTFPSQILWLRQNSSLDLPFMVAQEVKNLPTMQETRVQSLGWEDSPGEGNSNPFQ